MKLQFPLIACLLIALCQNVFGLETAFLTEARKSVEAQDHETAIRLYRKVLQLDAEHTTARKELAELLIDAQIKELDDEILAALSHQDHQKVPLIPREFPLHYLENIALGKEYRTINFDTLLILTQLHHKEIDAALKKASDLIQQQPLNPVAHNLLGLSFMLKGTFENSRTHFQRALEIKEDFHAARLNLAELELQQGELERARQILNQVLSREKNSRRASLIMAQLEKLQGRANEEKRWQQNALDSL